MNQISVSKNTQILNFNIPTWVFIGGLFRADTVNAIKMMSKQTVFENEKIDKLPTPILPRVVRAWNLITNTLIIVPDHRPCVYIQEINRKKIQIIELTTYPLEENSIDNFNLKYLNIQYFFSIRNPIECLNENLIRRDIPYTKQYHAHIKHMLIITNPFRCENMLDNKMDFESKLELLRNKFQICHLPIYFLDTINIKKLIQASNSLPHNNQIVITQSEGFKIVIREYKKILLILKQTSPKKIAFLQINGFWPN